MLKSTIYKLDGQGNDIEVGTISATADGLTVNPPDTALLSALLLLRSPAGLPARPR